MNRRQRLRFGKLPSPFPSRAHRTMFDLPSILLWAFATFVSAVMMASLIHRRREQLTGQLRGYVERHLEPQKSPDAAVEAAPQDTTDPID